jgi:3',5'-cyclic AMP phosphodiesterase CpdA
MKKRQIIIIIFFVVILIFLVVFLILNNLFFKEKFEFFSIIVLPDTQKYVEKYPEIFTEQVEWIVNNKEDMNIKFVIHLGDIVENWDNETQWSRANNSLSLLDKSNIPYSVVPGNHDHQSRYTESSTSFYNQYFPVSRFSDEFWWGGSYNENDNNYQLITIQGKDYIFLSLDFCPSEDEIKWADSVFTANENKKGILTTHGYVNASADRSVHVCGNTEHIWKDLIQNNSNLQIVLCGHVHGEANRIDYNTKGNVVYQLLADYQASANGGNGWLRIMKFVPSEDKIYVFTYSPFLNKSQIDADSQFILNY